MSRFVTCDMINRQCEIFLDHALECYGGISSLQFETSFRRYTLAHHIEECIGEMSHTEVFGNRSWHLAIILTGSLVHSSLSDRTTDTASKKGRCVKGREGDNQPWQARDNDGVLPTGISARQASLPSFSKPYSTCLSHLLPITRKYRTKKPDLEIDLHTIDKSHHHRTGDLTHVHYHLRDIGTILRMTSVTRLLIIIYGTLLSSSSRVSDRRARHRISPKWKETCYGKLTAHYPPYT